MLGKDARMEQGTLRNWRDGLLVSVVACACVLPNLGAHSLWDVDEARNAECAREMWEANDWIVPTFNYELRTDKPILPYWLMMVSFEWLGVNEWAARLPSALAGIATAVLTWWLSRRMFGPKAGLLAGLILPGAVLISVLSHAVTPDALLILWSLAALACAWEGIQRGNPQWLVWFGWFTGLAVLTKGVVGILLPATAVGLFLIWERKLQMLASRWLIWGLVVLLLVALPWYIAVGVATKGEWLRGFFGRHHYERFTTPLEGHAGGLWYHPALLLVGFAPWSVWLVPMLWARLAKWWRERNARRSTDFRPSGAHTEHDEAKAAPACSNGAISEVWSASAVRYLICWCGTWLVFFSLAQTKLPNYIAPIYPALAMLTGWWLTEWIEGKLLIPSWMVNLAVLVWAVIGVGVGAGLMLASGVVPLQQLEGRTIPGLIWLSGVAVIPVLGTAGAWHAWRSENRRKVVVSIVASGLIFVALASAWGPVLVHPAKVAHRLGQTICQAQTEQEIRVACYGWFQPSIVFYVRRPVANLRESEQAREWLDHPLESYLIVSRPWWEGRLRSQMERPYSVLASYWDFTRRREILLIVNRPTTAHRDNSSLAQQAVQLGQVVPGGVFGEVGSGLSKEIAGSPSAVQE